MDLVERFRALGQDLADAGIRRVWLAEGLSCEIVATRPRKDGVDKVDKRGGKELCTIDKECA